MESKWSKCVDTVTEQLKALGFPANEPLWQFLSDISIAVRRLEATTALPPLEFQEVTHGGLAAKFFNDLRRAAGKIAPCPETRSIRNRCRYCVAALGAIRSGVAMADRRPLVPNRGERARYAAAPDPEPLPFWVLEKLDADRENDERMARRKKR